MCSDLPYLIYESLYNLKYYMSDLVINKIRYHTKYFLYIQSGDYQSCIKFCSYLKYFMLVD